MVGEVVTWLLDKVFHRVGRHLNQAVLDIEDVVPRASSMLNANKVWANVEFSVVNGGKATAESYRGRHA